MLGIVMFIQHCAVENLLLRNLDEILNCFFSGFYNANILCIAFTKQM